MIAIIPARGGSKGLPGKNIKLLNGKPLIVHTIEAAINADCIDEVIVTTDSSDIAEISKKNGASVPFLRPSELASDDALAVDVYLHAVKYLENERNMKIDKFMILLPTSPLRTSQDIQNAYECFMQSGAETLVAVKEAPVPPGWYLSFSDDMKIKPCGFGTGKLNENRQSADEYVVPCGAIYILDHNLLKEKRTYYSDSTIGFKISSIHAADIDTLEDFNYAEYCLTKGLD